MATQPPGILGVWHFLGPFTHQQRNSLAMVGRVCQTLCMLVARGVTKSYGEICALQGADLDVKAGQIVSLLGRNGAGKSTLLSVIAGLTKPDGGAVEIGGLDRFSHPDEVAQMMGIAPQDTGVYLVLTVRENLEFFGELARLGSQDRRARADLVAEQLGLEKLLERRASQLSGGEVRRLHTACALVHRPRLLMLDEPTVGADVETRAALIQAVKELAGEGAAVIYTTHYLPEVDALDADVVIIDEGQILARGSREELIQAQALEGVSCVFDGELPLEQFGDCEVIRVGDDSPTESSSLDSSQTGAPMEGMSIEYRILGELSIADLLSRLGPQVAKLQSVEALRPDLEEVFLSITGGHLT